MVLCQVIVGRLSQKYKNPMTGSKWWSRWGWFKLHVDTPFCTKASRLYFRHKRSMITQQSTNLVNLHTWNPPQNPWLSLVSAGLSNPTRHIEALDGGSINLPCPDTWDTRWLEFRLVIWTGTKVRDLYFLKALPLGCSKLIFGNSLISIPVRHWTKTNIWRWFY